MGRTEAPGAVRRALFAAALMISTPSPASTGASFSLHDGVAPMASFRDGVFTVRARAEFERPDGYLALGFGSEKTPRQYFAILTQTGMKLWRIEGKERRLLDTGRFALSPKQEITLRFAIKGHSYLAEVQGYPPLVAEDEASFKGRLVLRAAGASVDYDDPVVELARAE